MTVLISNDAELPTLIAEEEIRAIAAHVLAAEGAEREVEISLSFVDESEMRELNHEWRGIDRTTDVLSFECDSAFDDELPADELIELGDVILAPEVIERQAPGFGNTPADECRLMLVHGLLHLLAMTISRMMRLRLWRPARTRCCASSPSCGERTPTTSRSVPSLTTHTIRRRHDSRFQQGPSVVLRSFGYAIEGFMTAVKTERNIKVMLVAGILTVIAGLVAKLQLISWALIAICIGLVIFAELCNTAMEAIVDLATQELHPLAKRAKDIAAASVYVLSITAAIVGILVFAHAFGFLGPWH